jgi:uncharacterized Zn finger protein
MGRRRRIYRDWYPARTAPIAVADGLAARHRRGRIGDTWWSQRWLRALESFELESRLARGRTYARRGQVLTVEIEPGRVTALVQGSQPTPYRVDISFHAFSEPEWTRIITVLAGQALFAAALLAGEMPENIEEAFAAAATSLFPVAMHEVDTQCTCPDWSNPCKHIAAVYYVMAEEFDRDPFLLFTLRGRTKEQILAALRAARTKTGAKKKGMATAPAAPLPQPVTQELLRTFWCASRAYPAGGTPVAANEATQLLCSLGAPPWREPQLLAHILDACRQAAQEAHD